MSVRELAPRRARGVAWSVSGTAWSLALGLSMLLAGWLLTDPRVPRLALAGAVSSLLVGLGLLAPRRMLYILVLWLAALGLVRRLFSELAPVGRADFLLLVAPVAFAALVLAAKERGAFRHRTRVANVVLVLAVLIALGAFNPLQGGVLVGLAGLTFVLVPVLAFWIGRGLCDDRTLETLLKLVAALGIAVALYGLGQTFLGFPHWDAAWIRDFGYAALNVHGHTRAFASFSAASEYATFLAVAIVIWLGFGLTLRWFPVTLGAVALLTVAVVYESSRGTVFTLVLALALMTAARARLPLAFGALVSVVVIVLIPLTVARVAPASHASSTSSIAGPGSTFVSHQVQGLARPLDPNASSLPDHLHLLKLGLRSAISNPLGRGTGSVTLAGDKFGSFTVGTETDPSNVAAALGIPGLLAYLAVLTLAFRLAYGTASARRDRLSLVALGLLAVTVLQWLNGGQYAVAFLPWLVLGWLDRASGRSHNPSEMEQKPE